MADFYVYAGLAGVLYLNFVGWTVAGSIVGPLVRNPAAWGFDFAFTAIFLALIVALWRGRSTAFVMAAAAIAAVVVEARLGGVWHVIAGAFAGSRRPVYRAASSGELMVASFSK